MMTKYKKRIRLKDFGYKGCYSYFITICTQGKKPIFTDTYIIKWMIGVLKDKSIIFGFKIWAYCFMPDHLHLLIEGNDENADMRRFISSYKQYTGFYYKKKYRMTLWQINYYDHILRKTEDTISVANYIFGNPVRRGLVDDYRKYKFLGSFEFDVERI